MALASLILGIISLIFCMLFFIPLLNLIPALAGIPGVILALIARKKLKEAGESEAVAMAGLATSLIGAVVGIMIWLACAACVQGTSSIFKEMRQDPLLQKKLEDMMNKPQRVPEPPDKEQKKEKEPVGQI